MRRERRLVRDDVDPHAPGCSLHHAGGRLEVMGVEVLKLLLGDFCHVGALYLSGFLARRVAGGLGDAAGLL